LAAVALCSLIIWSPYLEFERRRDFSDVRSQVFGVSLLPVTFSSSWCNPDAKLIRHPSTRPSKPEHDLVTSMLAQVVHPDSEIFTKIRAAVGALTANTSGASVVPGVPSLLLVALLVYGYRSVAGYREGRTSGPAARVVALGLLLPWGAIVLMGEPDRPDRTMWLWPLQLSIIAGAIAESTGHLRRDWPRAALLAASIAAVAANPFVLSQLNQWRDGGWAGSPPDDLRAVSYLGDQLKSVGATHASIGYQSYTKGFLARYNIVDPRYKWWSEFDAWLKWSYGIQNDNQCAEGVSGKDQWRIIDVRSDSAGAGTASQDEIVEGDMTRGFERVMQFGSYGVFRHQDRSPTIAK